MLIGSRVFRQILQWKGKEFFPLLWNHPSYGEGRYHVIDICIFPLISCGFHQNVHIVRGIMQISNVQNNHHFKWQTTRKPMVFSLLLSCSCLSKIKNIKKQGGIKRIPTNKQWNFLRGMGRMVKICMNYTRIGNTFNSAPPILARQQKIIQTNRYN